MPAPMFRPEQLHISVSQVKAWLRCPRAFEFRYVQGLVPEFKAVALAFGSSIHEALATYYQGHLDHQQATGLEAVIQSFRDSWQLESGGPVPLQLAEDNEPEDHVDKAVSMLTVFHQQAAAAEPMVVEAIESPFEVSIYDPDTGEVLDESLVGVFDLVINEDGNRVIVDHKSGSKKWTQAQFSEELQASGYSLAAQELGWGEVGIRFQVLTKAKSPQLQIENVIRGPTEEKDFLTTAVGVLRAIDAGISFPIRSWACRSCGYQAACARASKPARLSRVVGLALT